MPDRFGDDTFGSGTFGGVLTVEPPDTIIHPFRAEWKIIHYDHMGIALGEVAPKNLEFGVVLGQAGYVQYDIDITNPMAVRKYTMPYATDWALYRNGIPLRGGMHTAIKVGAVEEGLLNISGKDWNHWLEIREFPYDPLSSSTQGYTAAANADVFTIVEAIVQTTDSLPNGLSVGFPGGTNGLSGQTVAAFKIEAGDTEKLMSKIQNLAQTKPGFDFDITYNKKLLLKAPHMGTQRKIIFEQGKNIYTQDYTNNGPAGTHTLGMGQGTSSRVAVAIDHSTSAYYRRIDADADFSTVSDLTQLASLTQAEAERNASPQLEFSFKYIPEEGVNLWDQVWIGDTAKVVIDFSWDKLDEYMRIVSIVGNVNDEGDEEYTLTVDDATLSL